MDDGQNYTDLKPNSILTNTDNVSVIRLKIVKISYG